MSNILGKSPNGFCRDLNGYRLFGKNNYLPADREPGESPARCRALFVVIRRTAVEPPHLIFREQLGELLAVVVAQDKAGVVEFFDRPRRRVTL
jgi:hypothetical protein